MVHKRGELTITTLNEERAGAVDPLGELDALDTAVCAALDAAPSGHGGWLLPVEPLLRLGCGRHEWAPALAALHLRTR